MKSCDTKSEQYKWSMNVFANFRKHKVQKVKSKNKTSKIIPENLFADAMKQFTFVTSQHVIHKVPKSLNQDVNPNINNFVQPVEETICTNMSVAEVPCDKTNKHKVTAGMLYMIQEREFINTSEPVYKVGKTTQTVNKRLICYPKGSELLFTLKVSDCHSSETGLLAALRANFKERKDIGREYFEGSWKEMMHHFLAYV